MKLNIKKLEKAGSIPLNATANFWGINQGNYTKSYMDSTNAIANNPIALKKMQTTYPQITDRASFLNLATDSKIGPVHNAIKKIENSTTGLPNDLMKYPTKRYGTQTMTSRQFTELNKPEFDQHLSDLNNDSTAAYKKLTESVPGAVKIGNAPTKPYVNPLLNDRTRAGFAPRRKNGGYINYFVK